MSNTFFDADVRIPSDAEMQAYVLTAKRLRAEAMQTWAAGLRKKIAHSLHAAGAALSAPRWTTGLGAD
ncbi:MAG: hypothetical protein H6907_13455 [Hyphomicrobiales bacterium]|nr:hypothetical protein [Hyphomicrobiales bacterium]